MRDFVVSFAAQRRLSLSQMSQKLGYKSRTSLVRLMDAHVRSASVSDFVARMRRHFDLSDAEKAALSRAVEIKLYGEASYMADRALWSILRQEQQENKSSEIRVVDAESGEPVDLTRYFRDARKLDVTILNAEDAPVMGWVQRILQRPEARIRQYLRGSMDLTEMLNMLRTVSSALTDAGYHIYLRDPESTSGIPRRGSLVICDYLQDGNPREALICFQSQNRATILGRDSSGVFQRLVAPDLDSYHPLKDDGNRQHQAKADYVAYLAHCTQQERGREVLSIKSVPRYDTIPPEVFGDSLMEVIPPQVRQAGVALQRERVDNLRTCRRDIYTVHRLSEMRRLAETGRMPDHFWGMRTLTQAELAAWFRLLLELHRVNPAFHLLFLRDEGLVAPMEFTWVGGLGLILMPQSSSYDFGGNHVETLIYHEEMMSAYHDFFMTQIVQNSCLSEEESLALLEELAAACEDRAGKGANA